MANRTRMRFPLASLFALCALAFLALPVAASPTTGTIQVAIILIDFNDASYDSAHDSDWFEELAFGNSNSMWDYYDENSRGNLTLEGEVFGPYTLDGDAADWGSENTNFVSDTIAAADDDIDYRDYDAVMAVHTGPGEESSGNSDDIWSIHWSGLSISTNDGNHRIREITQVPEFEYSGGEKRPLGVWVHEFGHELGLPDFYDTDYSSEGIGDWGVMASGSWADNGETPVHFSGFSKAEVGWLEPLLVTGDLLDVRLEPASRNGKILKLPVPGNWSNAREYFLLENRQQLDYDTYLPGEGLLIWHVDEDVSNNNDESHKRLDLEEADGYDDLDNNWNSGDSGDPYGAGDEFTDEGYPDSTAYNQSDSGWRISNIRTDGDDILLDIRFLSKPHALADAADGVVDAGEELQFWGGDSWDDDGSITNFTWDFKDGTFAYEADPLHVFDDYGTYDVTLTVRDDDWLTDSVTVTIRVNALPVPVIVAEPQSVWLGESISFSGSQSWDPDGSIAFWFWNFDDGSTSSEVSVEHLFDAPGFYNVSLKVADDLNAIATGYLVVEVRNRLPHASFGISPAEGNTTIEFYFADSSSDPDGSVVVWEWNFGDGNSSGGETSMHRFALPGIYAVTLTVTDNYGGSNSSIGQLEVSNALPLLEFEIPEGVWNGTRWVVPANLPLTLNGSGSHDPEGLPLEYTWDIDGASLTGAAPEVLLATGWHSVTLIVTDAHDAVVEKSFTLLAVVQPLLEVSPAVVDALTGEVTAFTATTLQGNITTWVWVVNDNPLASAESLDFTPPVPGSYDLQVRGLTAEGLPSPWAVAALEAFDSPIANFTIEGSLVQLGWLAFNGTHSQGLGLEYSWKLDGEPLPNATAVAMALFEEGGSYTIALNVTQQPVGTAQLSRSFYLNHQPVAIIESLEPARPRIGQEFSFRIAANDDEGAAVVESVAWPDGLAPLSGGIAAGRYSASALFNGTEHFALNVTLSDEDGASGVQQVWFTVFEWPDGVASALTWNGSREPGKQGKFEATVANAGGDLLTGTATLELDGRPLQEWELQLNPGEEAQFSAPWEATPGSHRATLLVALNEQELETANNQLNLTIEIDAAGSPLPLLAIGIVGLGVIAIAVTFLLYRQRPPTEPPEAPAPEPVEAIVVDDTAWRR
jgi:M6 family metalloprotease-like protein